MVGTLHGSFKKCSREWPTIYTRIDDSSIMSFIRKIILNENVVDLPGILNPIYVWAYLAISVPLRMKVLYAH